MRIGEKMYVGGIVGILVSDEFFGCELCCFKPETCPKPNENELHCIDYETNQVGVFKQITE